MKLFIAIVVLAVAVSAVPVEQELGRLAMQNPDLYQGDILGIDPGDRNVVPDKARRWPRGVVPYSIDPILKRNARVKSVIEKAMRHFERNTCIRFKERRVENPYLKIFPGEGCYSYVGMVARRQQPLSLGYGCHHFGSIIHELGHALGLYHEQNRSDRDKYLIIYWDNIQRGMNDQFALLKPSENLLITPFDYNSIMIYGNYAFSRDGYSITMKARNGQRLSEPLEKGGLTSSDIKRINRMYNCDDNDDDDDDDDDEEDNKEKDIYDFLRDFFKKFRPL